MNVLVVDDERAIREGIRRTVVNAFPQMEVSTAASASEALQVLQQARVQVVFLDIMMPGMNGLELLKHVRGSHAYTKWIVVTAHSEFAYAQEALRLGARDYILKPIGKDQIIEAIAALEAEYDVEKRQTPDAGLFELNLKYLREAVFRRWIWGLDIGRFDLTAIKDEYEHFHLITVRLASSVELTLHNFIVENVMSEYLGLSGKGFILSLEGDFLTGVVMLREGLTPDAFTAGANEHLTRYLKVAYQFYTSPLLSDFYAIPSEIRKLHTAGNAPETAPPSENKNDVIDIALQYIRSNFKENLSLEIVASVVFLNPVYFSKLFKQKTGNGYKEYVTQLRMERAKELLAAPDMSVTRVGELVGYPDVRHFTQVFRKYHESTPSQYRLVKKSL
ncbi:response regulator [Bacillus sp. FJAT-26390]|uniref:response regulator n=1 Tax=Bacillus sp. FJAT-26390 TaxID=1743142 RepID=UPI00080808B8|nr:response regulator [Bacillus sp. FJAT-26390]OBZ11273.1 DNA-binding response regulator [Bacillus sp. FJAT-26390]